MAKQRHQTRPRPRAGDLMPINETRIACADMGPPASFDPAQAPAGTGKPLPGPWRRYPDKRKPPALAQTTEDRP